MKNEACLDRNGTKMFSPTDAINTLAHHRGMFDYFKGTCASYALPTHLNVKSGGCLGRFQHFSCGLLMFLFSKSNISVQKDCVLVTG